MTDKLDPLGVYATLGLRPSATQEEIRLAYRQLAKQYHPDRDKTPGAVKRFQAVAQAYQIIGNIEDRTKYDTWSCNQSEQSAENEGAIPLLFCEQCNFSTPHLRIVAVHWVWSALIITRHGYRPMMLCSSCASRALCIANVKSALFGWWGFPFGPLLTPVAILKNTLAAPNPVDANVSMFIHQAAAYAQRGNLDKAHQARRNAEVCARGEFLLEQKVQEFVDYLPIDRVVQHESDPWSLGKRAAIPRLASVLFSFIVVFFIGSLINRDSVAKARVGSACETQQQQIEIVRVQLEDESKKLDARNSLSSSTKAEIENGRFSEDLTAFNTKVDRYNYDVAQFRNDVQLYNQSSKKLSKNINTYNGSCVQ